MYCKECGKNISDDSKFCTYCGTEQNLILEEESSHKSSPKEIKVKIGFDLPSISLSSLKKAENSKFDESYDRPIGIGLIGGLVVGFGQMYTASETEGIIALFISIGIALFVSIFVSILAEDQNRDKIGWAVFGFFLPVIALISIGFCKKIKKLDDDNFEGNQLVSEHELKTINSFIKHYEDENQTKQNQLELTCLYSEKGDVENSYLRLQNAFDLGAKDYTEISEEIRLKKLRESDFWEMFVNQNPPFFSLEKK